MWPLASCQLHALEHIQTAFQADVLHLRGYADVRPGAVHSVTEGGRDTKGAVRTLLHSLNETTLSFSILLPSSLLLPPSLPSFILSSFLPFTFSSLRVCMYNPLSIHSSPITLPPTPLPPTLLLSSSPHPLPTSPSLLPHLHMTKVGLLEAFFTFMLSTIIWSSVVMLG